MTDDGGYTEHCVLCGKALPHEHSHSAWAGFFLATTLRGDCPSPDHLHVWGFDDDGNWSHPCKVAIEKHIVPALSERDVLRDRLVALERDFARAEQTLRGQEEDHRARVADIAGERDHEREEAGDIAFLLTEAEHRNAALEDTLRDVEKLTSPRSDHYSQALKLPKADSDDALDLIAARVQQVLLP